MIAFADVVSLLLLIFKHTIYCVTSLSLSWIEFIVYLQTGRHRPYVDGILWILTPRWYCLNDASSCQLRHCQTMLPKDRTARCRLKHKRPSSLLSTSSCTNQCLRGSMRKGISYTQDLIASEPPFHRPIAATVCGRRAIFVAAAVSAHPATWA